MLWLFHAGHCFSIEEARGEPAQCGGSGQCTSGVHDSPLDPVLHLLLRCPPDHVHLAPPYLPMSVGLHAQARPSCDVLCRATEGIHSVQVAERPGHTELDSVSAQGWI